MEDEKADRLGQEGKKKCKKAKAAAYTAATSKAKRVKPAGKKDPLREVKYEEVRFHMACGHLQKAACKAVGVPESSFRSWNKKQQQPK